MRPANYAVVRYTPDPARNECLNVGVVLWDEFDWRAATDESAISRVIRENPWLASDALAGLERMLHQHLSALSPFDSTQMVTYLTARNRFPVSVTEARYTTLEEGQPDALGHALNHLIRRVVTPRRRGGRGAPSSVDIIEKRLKHLIERRIVERNHTFDRSVTGILRTVDFFANSGADVVLDALRLSVKRADEIRMRADAEAFKVRDILEAQPVKFVVYCELSDTPELETANAQAKMILKSVDAIVETDIDKATGHLDRISESLRA